MSFVFSLPALAGEVHILDALNRVAAGDAFQPRYPRVEVGDRRFQLRYPAPGLGAFGNNVINHIPGTLQPYLEVIPLALSLDRKSVV